LSTGLWTQRPMQDLTSVKNTSEGVVLSLGAPHYEKTQIKAKRIKRENIEENSEEMMYEKAEIRVPGGGKEGSQRWGCRSQEQLSQLRFLSLCQGDFVFQALIDTGAQLNVGGNVAGKLIRGRKLNLGKLRLKAAFQGVQQIDYWVAAEFTLGTKQIQVPIAILPILGEVFILGLPFLESARAKIDMEQNLICLYGEWFELQTSATANLYAIMIDSADQTSLNDIIERAQLSGSCKERLEDLLMRYLDVWSGESLGQTEVVKHSIELDTPYPIVQRPRRIPLDKQEIIDAELNTMLDKKVVRPSRSAYAQEVVLVKKKDGKWRFCIDYRLLNSHTIPDKHPLPRIQDLLRSVRGSAAFVALDLRAGYWQISMEESSIPFTAFRTHRGLFEWTRMPFGLINAPASFQRLMERVLGDLRWKGVLVYIDDVLIHTPSVDETLRLLEEVFSRFRNARLTIKISKCDFFPKRVEYLGHIVEAGQLRPNPSRIAVLRTIKPPRSVKELRSVLGCFGYYREYIPKFSEYAAPLCDLLKKGSIFAWRPEFIETLEYFTDQLATVTLANALETEEFLLETDASEVAVGAVLSCRTKAGNWRPVEFGSRTLSEVERRWPAHEREAYAIVWALDKFDHFLRGRTFIVYTDNKSLVFLDKAKRGKLARWAARMAEYSLEIYHKEGKRMQHIDFLSRYIEPAEEFLADRMFFSIFAFPSVEDIRISQKGRRPYGKGYMYRDELWFYRGKLWVPEGIRPSIIATAHMQPPYIHPGARRTKATIIKFFCWPNLHQDVAQYIKSCLACQRIRPGTEQLQGLIRSHPISDLFDRVYMDIWEVDFGESSYKFLTLLEWNTRWVECCLLKSKEAEEVAKTFLVGWVCRFGTPKILITDNEPSFVGKVFTSLCGRLGIRKVHTTIYHPQGNAPIETFHRHLRKGLGVFNLEKRSLEDINEAVQLCCLAYRSQIHLALNDSPAFRLYGVDLPLPIGGDWRYGLGRHDRERVRFLNLQRLDIQSRANIIERSQAVVGHPGPVQFLVGDLVLMRLQTRDRLAAAYQDGSKKLAPKWSMPYRVVRVLRNGQTALLRPLAGSTGLKEAHIQDCRFISEPDETQKELWERLGQEVDQVSAFVPSEYRDILDINFEELKRPQKRSRI
jgi:hypothetical protein